MEDAPCIGISAASGRSAASTCPVCHQAVSKYTCPKCRTLYCSSDCYNRHNDGRCVRQFQEEQVLEAVKAARVTAIDKRNFEQKLSRIRAHERAAEDEDDDEGDAPRERGPRGGRASEGERRREEEAEGDESGLLNGMDDERHAQLMELAHSGLLDEDALTEEERRAFHHAVGTGALAQYLEPWEPWWQKAELHPPVAPPPHCCCAPERKVHFAVFNTLLQLMYAYAHCMRSYNGDVEEVELQEACQHILAVAQALGASQPPPTPLESLDVAITATSSHAVQCKDPEFNALCLQDLKGLFSCREHAFHAIEETLRMLHGLLEMVAEVQEEEKAEDEARLAAKLEGKERGKREEEREAFRRAVKERRQHLKTLSRNLQMSERKVLFLGSFLWHHWAEVSALVPAAMVHVKAKEEQLQAVLKEIQTIKASRAAAARAYAMSRRCDDIGAVPLSSLSPHPKSSAQTLSSQQGVSGSTDSGARAPASQPPRARGTPGRGEDSGAAAARDSDSDGGRNFNSSASAAAVPAPVTALAPLATSSTLRDKKDEPSGVLEALLIADVAGKGGASKRQHAGGHPAAAVWLPLRD
ncbi:HIT zinc finger protein [Besnoitia besnoiti]|uniref:HIT zinc finger protein n=1 Tax=Besnoitia besnoiti TaxID=94643 RepID=A0A2A9MDF9_BESBE|nr:HIT zinc finger protein [Besnoitia besnoiti]PFH36538.1 HIT zinc finger protein [Besnoitia besnoiti]